MKPITAYQSVDGRVFERAQDCAEYENHCHILSKIIRGLPKFDHNHDYDIGKAYYQHDPERWLKIRNELLLYIDQRWGDLYIRGLVLDKGTEAMIIDYKIMNAFLRKNCDIPSLLAWQMVGYVDDDFRQWSQPTYAMDKGRKGKCINS
jgi:hypothetical protein